MNIYLVSIEHQWYDTYDWHVVIADNEEYAKEVCMAVAANEWREIWNRSEVTLLWPATIDKKGIILSSFNAG